MKALVLVMASSFLVASAFGQGAQADQIKRRAKELSNENNVRQGVPPPSQTTARPATPVPPATPTGPAPLTQEQSLAKLKADLAGFKTGAAATADQKQKFTVDLAVTAHTTKPTLNAVKKFVDALTAGLSEATLTSEHQARLAQNLDAVLNSKGMSATQFDAIIADVQAILQVGGVKRTTAAGIAADLKSVGAEVRR
jgi:hypothetical protein